MKTNKASQGPPQTSPKPQLQNIPAETGLWKSPDPLARVRRQRFLRYQKWILRASAVCGLCLLPANFALGAGQEAMLLAAGLRPVEELPAGHEQERTIPCAISSK